MYRRARGPPSRFCKFNTFTLSKIAISHYRRGLCSQRVGQMREDHCNNVAFPVQVYNEEVIDLLNPSKGKLSIRENGSHAVFVDGLSERLVTSAK